MTVGREVVVERGDLTNFRQGGEGMLLIYGRSIERHVHAHDRLGQMESRTMAAAQPRHTSSPSWIRDASGWVSIRHQWEDVLSDAEFDPSEGPLGAPMHARGRCWRCRRDWRICLPRSSFHPYQYLQEWSLLARQPCLLPTSDHRSSEGLGRSTPCGCPSGRMHVDSPAARQDWCGVRGCIWHPAYNSQFPCQDDVAMLRAASERDQCTTLVGQMSHLFAGPTFLPGQISDRLSSSLPCLSCRSAPPRCQPSAAPNRPSAIAGRPVSHAWLGGSSRFMRPIRAASETSVARLTSRFEVHDFNIDGEWSVVRGSRHNRHQLKRQKEHWPSKAALSKARRMTCICTTQQVVHCSRKLSADIAATA